MWERGATPLYRFMLWWLLQNRICESPISKMYVWVKQVDLIQNPYKQREALAEQWWTFQLLFLCKIESSRATSMRMNVG